MLLPVFLAVPVGDKLLYLKLSVTSLRCVPTLHCFVAAPAAWTDLLKYLYQAAATLKKLCKSGAELHLLGPRHFKGVKEEVTCYQVCVVLSQLSDCGLCCCQHSIYNTWYLAECAGFAREGFQQ